MTGLPFLLLAAAIAEPDLPSLLTNDDYPESAFRAGQSAAVFIDLRLSEEGRVTKCKVLSYVGSQDLADLVCPAVAKKTVKPARLATGHPAPAALRTVIRLRLTDVPGSQAINNIDQPPDLELTVQALPGGAKVLDTAVTAAIGTSGETLTCQAAANAKNTELVGIACSQLQALTIAPLIGSDGLPVPYVTIQRVRFKAP